MNGSKTLWYDTDIYVSQSQKCASRVFLGITLFGIIRDGLKLKGCDGFSFPTLSDQAKDVANGS